MYLILEAIVKIIGYSFFFYGLWMMFGSPYLQSYIVATVKHWKKSRKIKRLEELNDIEKKEKDKSQIIKHLDLLLSALKKDDGNHHLFNFIVLTSLIFVVTTSTLYTMIDDLIFSIISGLFFASFPYLYLRFKLITIRLKTSYSFLQNYHLILQSYQSNGRDIYYTIQEVARTIQDKELKKRFMILMSSIQKDRKNEEFKKAVMVFIYAVNSTPAKRFGRLLIKAHIDRSDISVSLMDLNENIKKRKQDMELDKTQKIETIIMGYAPIVLLPLMFFIAYRIAGIRDFWIYFQNKLALTLFVICIIFTGISVLSAYVISKPKADI